MPTNPANLRDILKKGTSEWNQRVQRKEVKKKVVQTAKVNQVLIRIHLNTHTKQWQIFI